MKDRTEQNGDLIPNVNSESCLCLHLFPFLGVKRDVQGNKLSIWWEYIYQDGPGDSDFTEGHTANQMQKLCEDLNTNFLEDLSDLRI